MKPPPRRRIRGLTLIEMLVVVALIALLLALILPAIFDSRQAAHRLQCSSHLRQIELGALAYHDTFNVFPAYFGSFPGPGQFPHYYSIHARITPQLDQMNLYNSINFESFIQDDVAPRSILSRDFTYISPANTTAMMVTVPIFLCPSDPAPTGSAPCQGTNYRANYGTRTTYYGDRERLAGPFTFRTPSNAGQVLDGLSHTAAFGEKPRGDAGRTSFDNFVDPLVDPVRVDPPAPELYAYCGNQPIIPANYRTTTGINWLVGGLTQTCYNHMTTPNSPTPDCLEIGILPGRARATARSYHAAGANVAMADGSVRFASANVNFRTWQALGTRAGGEVIDE